MNVKIEVKIAFRSKWIGTMQKFKRLFHRIPWCTLTSYHIEIEDEQDMFGIAGDVKVKS